MRCLTGSATILKVNEAIFFKYSAVEIQKSIRCWRIVFRKIPLVDLAVSIVTLRKGYSCPEKKIIGENSFLFSYTGGETSIWRRRSFDDWVPDEGVEGCDEWRRVSFFSLSPSFPPFLLRPQSLSPSFPLIPSSFSCPPIIRLPTLQNFPSHIQFFLRQTIYWNCLFSHYRFWKRAEKVIIIISKRRKKEKLGVARLFYWSFLVMESDEKF